MSKGAGLACGTPAFMAPELFMVWSRGLHSFTLELNLSTFGSHSWVKLGYVGQKDSSS